MLQVLGAASARLNAALQKCAPEAGVDISGQRQSLDAAIYFLDFAATAVSDSLAPPVNANPQKTALQPGAQSTCQLEQL